ncbi:MAG: hypothetical protein JXB49_27760, partial [Bacteroidales bacterium]|nr:hypothetical protein [Bacteroidales bacterium]
VVQFGQRIVYASDDGIYQLAPNMESAADDTPFIKNRISEPINDVYEAFIDKTSIRGIYDDQNAELVFFFDSSADYALWASDSNGQLESSDDILLYAKGEAGRIWAYSILNGTWREIYSDVFGDIVALDENGKVMVYDDADSKIYGITDQEAVVCAVRTKEYTIGGKYKRLLHSVYVEYKSAVSLALELYTDGGTTASKTVILAASPVKITKQVILRKWCKTIRIRIAEPEESASEVEIYAIYEDKR